MGNVEANGSNTVTANEIHAHYDYFYFNYVAMTAAYFGIFVWEYYTMAWTSIMYFWGYPIFFLQMVIEKWNLTDLPFLTTISRTGLESLQYMYLYNTKDDIKYHYLAWNYPYQYDWKRSGSPSYSAAELKDTVWDPAKPTEVMANRVFISFGRLICDFLTMLTVPFVFLNPVGAILNFIFLWC